ncbi:bifunctional diaminohydroxyphosphoribosylaminopyrimidine deaminase/5-amino-6-(5-phosphoribosylamino)uracil reductase RibD [Petrachloros mirabilis]
MTLALRLAEKGRGTASPNPMVGAVVVKQGRIVGCGFHHRPGEPHAEILALRQAGKQAAGATLYVTLEPCCHLKKRTPPCVPAVVRSGVSRVVVAMHDPNPKVKGKGITRLRRSGLSVTTGVARREAEDLNRAFAYWINTKRPYVTLKAGMTLDGRIATASGESKWITSRQSRQEVHRLRSEVDAVLVGIGTVLSDNPAMTARTGPRFKKLARRQPLRVVVDSALRIPLKAQILSQQEKAKTLVATTRTASAARLAALKRKGIETVMLPDVRGRVDLTALLRYLGQQGIASLLVEGGSEVNAAVMKAKLVQHVRLYIAPGLLGGRNAAGVIGGESPLRLAQMVTLKRVRTRSVGGDVVVEGDL